MTTTTANHTAFGGLDTALVRIARGIHAGYRARRDRARTRRALDHLSDDILRDIGIHRSEIGSVAGLNRLNDRF